MPKVNKVKENERKSDSGILSQVALGLSILSLVVSIVSFAEVNSTRAKQCSVIGVDMVTQKVTLDCN